MKQLFALLSIHFFISVAGAQPGHVNILPLKLFTLSQLNLHGKVKSITETNFNKKISGYEEGGPLTSQFDPQGKLSETKNVLMFSGTSMGTVIEKYSYNAKGKLSKIIIGDGTGKDDETQTYTYDAKGNLVGMDYAALGKITKEKYEYDAQNRLTVKKYFGAGDKIPYTISRYTYDVLNRVTLVEQENTEKKKSTRIRYSYTGNNLQHNLSSYEGERDMELNTKGITQTEYEYNAAGDVITVSPVNASGKIEMDITRYVYEYDKNANWTKVTRSGWGAGYITRRIEYYPAEVIVSPVDAYKNAVAELIEPPLKSVGDLMNSAMDKISTAVVLQQDKKAMIALAKTNIEKLKKVPDLPGNNTKQLSIKLLQFVIAEPTLKKIDNAILQTGDYNKDSKELANDLGNMRKELVAEFKKL